MKAKKTYSLANVLYGLTDRDLLGNAFLSRLEHFGLRQDTSPEGKAFRAMRLVLPETGELTTLGIEIDDHMLKILDVCVDAFQAIPTDTWERAALDFGYAHRTIAYPAGRTGVFPAADDGDPAAVGEVQEVADLYDRMSMRATNTLRGLILLPPAALEEGGSTDGARHMNRRERRKIASFYNHAVSLTAYRAAMCDPGTAFAHRTDEEAARFARQVAVGRTIRLYGFDAGPPGRKPP